MFRKSFLVPLFALLVAFSAFAQPDPADPQPVDPAAPVAGAPGVPGGRGGMRGGQPGQPGGNLGGMFGGARTEPVMEATPQGIFVLQGGVLTRLDAKTLVPAATVQLFGPAPQRPAERNDRAAARAYADAMDARRAPASLFVSDKSVIALVGDEFFILDPATLTIGARTNLAPPPPPGAAPDPAADPNQPGGRGGMRGGGARGPAPVIRLVGDIVFVLRGTDITAVNAVDGTVVANGKLPEEMAPPQPAFGGMFGGAPAPGVAVAPGAPGAAPSYTGRIVKEMAAAGDQYILTTGRFRGERYLLKGGMLAKVIAAPNALQNNVTIRGVLTAPPAGVTNITGVIEVQEFAVGAAAGGFQRGGRGGNNPPPAGAAPQP